MDEIISRLNENKIRYVLIGGQAIRLHGMPRFTMDWDIYIPGRDQKNIDKINQLLEEELDLPLVPLGPSGENFVQTFQTFHGVVQFHLGGPGLPKFDDAEHRAVMLKTESGILTRCLSGADLLNAKRAANRPQDQDDIRFLEKSKELGRLR